MKKLMIALLCLATVTSAYAGNTNSPKLPVLTKVVTVNNPSKITVSTKENKNLGLYRRQMSFKFYDICGQVLTVYVSGASSASNHELYDFAYNYAFSSQAMYYGCFK